MKKLIALIVLMSGLAVTAQAETKVLLSTHSEGPKSLSIEAGQIARCLSYIHSDSDLKGEMTIEIGKQAMVLHYRDMVFEGNELPVVPGPATITLRARGESKEYGTMATFKIENDSGVGDGNNVTVIPDSTENATLVLEGSDDMVNWTVETLGEKPKANRKKFYRLRVNKE